jgi:glycosyltransferase involved in cell wall biosynthesis
VCVLGEARHPGFVAPALEGLARVGIEAFVFIDEEADAKGSVWTLADKLGLRERIDLVPSLEENRELALRCDALLVPGPANRHRSVVLDAMAAGVAVAASRDPYVHVLNTPGLAWLVEGTAPEDWADQITGAITPGSGRDRRLADARRFVDEERSPSRHIESLQGIYQGVCDPDPIAFQTVASA